MKRAIFVLLFIAGCRGIVGIEDLTLVDGGAGDAGSNKDSGQDAAPPIDAAPDSATMPCGNTTHTGDCTMCCFQANMGMVGGAWLNVCDAVDSCACTDCAGPCASNKVCGQSASAGGSMCLGCLGGTFIKGTCAAFNTRCTNDQSCRTMAQCLDTCRGLPQ